MTWYNFDADTVCWGKQKNYTDKCTYFKQKTLKTRFEFFVFESANLL